MKALGVALAACCAVVFWPSAAHANPIGAHEAAERTKLATDPGWQAFDGDRDADDGIFTAEAGLDQSVHFAATGTTDVFNDDRASLGNVIDVEGLSTAAQQPITLGLRMGDHDGDNDANGEGPGNNGQGHAYAWGHEHNGPKVSDPPSDPPGDGAASVSATPEPASVLLIATGLAGLVFYRRRLFV